MPDVGRFVIVTLVPLPLYKTNSVVDPLPILEYTLTGLLQSADADHAEGSTLAAGAAVTELADPITTILEKQLGLFQEITLELPVNELLLTG